MPGHSAFAFLVAVLLGSLPAHAQPVADSLQLQIVAVKRMLEKRPADPTVHFYLASFQAQAKQRDNALASLARVLALGDGFLPGSHFGFDSLKADPDFLALRAAFERKLPVHGAAPVAFSIADQSFGPEGIAYDPLSKQFFVGSVTHKRVVRISPAGKMTPLSGGADGLHSVLGVAVDARRRIVYAVSTNALSKGKPLVNAVVAFDIASGKRLHVIPVPEAEQLNDVAIAPSGELYVTDSGSGAVWRIGAVKPYAVAPFVAPGAVGGSNGVAVSADGKTVYVAHSTGVVRVDAASGKLERLVPPARQTIAAIDGLYLWQGDLLGIQNITNPGRVIRMRLNSAGTEILRVDTLQSHHNPAFSEPTTGAIAGAALYVLGTTQLPQFNDKGEIEKAGKLKNPLVVRVPLPRN
ncbi:MAG: SMP-30/gluconolactonase/LRE family protein [Pseudomonadota bacterium]